ncbi:MAG: SpoIIE family protein phosphatase [Clostridia bacterium]|nr:SpoIIE family protein phosphatase [Clostridia bacterium]
MKKLRGVSEVFQDLKSKIKYEDAPEESAFSFMDKLFFREVFSSIKNVIVLIIGLLVSSCKMASGATPFGLAILGATSLINIPLIIPFLAISVITGLLLGKVALLKFVISGLLFVAIKAFIKTENTKIGNAGIVIFSCMMSEIVGLSIEGMLLYNALFAVYNSIMTGVFFLIFSEGLPVIYSFDKERVNASESLMCAGIILAVLVSSFGDLGIAGITFRGVMSILAVMLLGWKCGAAVGATSGLSISLVLGIVGYGSVATVATYAFCGMLSGILARYGKIGAVIGFVIGNIVLVFFANGSTEVLISIKEIIVASALLFLIPKKLIVVIDNLFDYNRVLAGEGVAGYIEENTIYKLGAVSDVINDMAENVSTAKNVVATTDEIGSFIKTLNENTCKRCENYNKCWKQNYHKMYEQTFNAIEVLQVRGEIVSEDLQDSICEKKDLFAEGLNLSYEIYKVNKDWQEKVKEQRIQMAMQLKEVSKELNKVKENISNCITVVEEDEATVNEPYTLELGIARTKKYNSTISGDSNTIIKLKDGKILVAISDGMGSGDVAARNSKKVVLNLEKLLNTGFEEDRAVKLINSYMLVGKEPDNFATIDAMVFDPLVGLTEFIKIGACPTFICNKNGNVCTIDSNSLPVGLVGDIEIETKTKLLKRGDLLVMVTDGILDANFDKKDQAIVDLLKAVKTTSAQRLADIMLQESIDCNFGMPKDDMTVIVARVQ